MNKPFLVSEIFLSIQGESTYAGLPCVLVRLAGCNLRCQWCDTPYAQDASDAEAMSIEEIMAAIEKLSCRRVEITGGEPLVQASCLELLRRLCDAGYKTRLDTTGSQEISVVDPRVVRIVDFKCPSSRQESANRWDNSAHLKGGDEVKFVLADRSDYDFAKTAIQEYQLIGRCKAVFFSPVWGQLDTAELAGWIIQDGLDVRLGLQMHKIIWPENHRGV